MTDYERKYIELRTVASGALHGARAAISCIKAEAKQVDSKSINAWVKGADTIYKVISLEIERYL